MHNSDLKAFVRFRTQRKQIADVKFEAYYVSETFKLIAGTMTRNARNNLYESYLLKRFLIDKIKIE